MKKSSRQKRMARHRRVRSTVIGTGMAPRLSVFRSNKHIWTQLVDDTAGITIVAASDRDLSGKESEKKTRAAAVGALIAKRAQEKGIQKVRFDRGGYAYHGIVREVAEGARKGGLQF